MIISRRKKHPFFFGFCMGKYFLHYTYIPIPIPIPLFYERCSFLFLLSTNRKIELVIWPIKGLQLSKTSLHQLHIVNYTTTSTTNTDLKWFVFEIAGFGWTKDDNLKKKSFQTFLKQTKLKCLNSKLSCCHLLNKIRFLMYLI